MKAVFLDRDGVININPPNRGYVCNWTDFTFLNNSLEAICHLFRNGFSLFIITNQAGIGKGNFTENQLEEIHFKMLNEIENVGGFIQHIYYCPHKPNDDCDCRKPKPGMLYKAARENNIDLSNTFFIGDSISDIEAAATAGAIPILVLTGHGRETYNYYIKGNISLNFSKPTRIFTNLYSVSRWLSNQNTNNET